MTSRRTWQGFYYDGRTADRQAVSLRLELDGLHVALPAGEVVWPIVELRQTQGSFSAELVRLERGTDPVEVLLVQEPGFVEAMRALYPQSGRRLRPRRSVAALLGISGAIIAGAVVAYVWGAPILAGWLAPRVPPSWEMSMGQSVAQRLAPDERRCRDSTGLAALRSVVDRLTAADATARYPFSLVVLRDTVVNAFAAPGGFIAVNDGLLQAARSPEEVAGVLAHEIQHVVRQHSTRAIIREAPLRIALATLGSGTGLETAASVAGSIGALRYRRGDEAEADREGLRMLAAAGVDPKAMVTFMQTLERKAGDAPRLVSYLSSHPHTADRVAELARLAGEREVRTRPLLEPAEWAAVRTMCDR